MIFMAGGNAYSLLHENKNGWNPEAFRERYSEVLERFDYIVGDWGYSQLRLRGFYKDGHPRAAKESAISSLVDYVNEYCNFGCAYFVVAKVDSNALSPEELALSQQSVAGAASAAVGEAGEQAAETAATYSGPLMRWPLKERTGGPVRVPNVTVSAVARAAAESAERRKESNAGSGGSGQHRGGSRQGHEGGGSHNRHGKQAYGQGGGERRQGQGSGSQGHNQERAVQQGRGDYGQHRGHQGGSRGPRPQQNVEGGNRQAAEGRNNGESGVHPNAEAAHNGSRWPGKNRRRKSYGNKQGPRPEGAQRTEAGSNPYASE